MTRWCWRASVAENSCACQDGCELPPDERGEEEKDEERSSWSW